MKMTNMEMEPLRQNPANDCTETECILRNGGVRYSKTTNGQFEHVTLLPHEAAKNKSRAGGLELEPEDGLATLPGSTTTCGLGWFAPQWLQPLASDKAYAVLHGLVGMSFFVISTYFVGTISTLEKRFNIPSRTAGMITGASEMSSSLSVLLLSYLGSRGHRPRWMAAGTLLVALSCLLRMLPHLLYGPGGDALSLTKEHGATGLLRATVTTSAAPAASLCGATDAARMDADRTCRRDVASASAAPAGVLFAANALMGVGASLYYTLGLAYMDDNARKSKSPLLFAMSQCVRILGPTLGYLLASFTLRLYVAPTLTPVIESSDPRWIGAWWLAWVPLGVMELGLSAALCLFPKQLPATARRLAQAPDLLQPLKPSFRDFWCAIKRLLSNKVLMLNTASTVCFMFGYIGYWTFIPKYLETQFRQSASRASLLTGSSSLGFTAAGLLLSSLYISRARPSARAVAAWSVLVEALDVAVHLAKPFLGCAGNDLQGRWDFPQHTWNMTLECNAGCSCGPHVKYAPVCAEGGATTFYSACHAGCHHSALENGTMVFSGCSCIPGSGRAVEGACPADCAASFVGFLALHCISSFLVASGRAGNLMLQFRCVREVDKALSMGFSEVMLCALAFAPGPVVYGALLDSVCLVWGETCGQKGSCWLYDGESLRYLLNFTAAGFLIAGTVLDVGVWYYVKGLQIYDEDDDGSGPDEASSKAEPAVAAPGDAPQALRVDPT